MTERSLFKDLEIPEGLEFSQLNVRWNARKDDIDYDPAAMWLIAIHNGLDPDSLLGNSPDSRTLASLIMSVWYSVQRRQGGERNAIFEQIFAEVEAWIDYGATRVQRSFGSVH